MPHTDPNYPTYHGDMSGHETQSYLDQLGGKRAFSGLVDKLYFVFAGIASIWLAVEALLVAFTSSWWSVPLILVIWVVAAYMTIPRFHRIMTTLYVPSYFIGRTQTGDGLLGDPVNIGLRGESVDVQRAMEAAGWHQAEPVTLASSWRIIVNTLRKKPYPTAPVSPLYLFDRKEDFAFQQEVDGSPEKRHHVRFWKTPPGWKLPGGVDVDWVAAATFDRAVGLSLFTFQVTHKIDANTDSERDYVVDTVMYCNKDAELSVIEDFSTGYHSRNGGGDSIITDGNLPILNLHHVVPEELEIPDDSPKSAYSYHRRPWQLVESAPIAVWIAGFFVSIVALIQLTMNILQLSGTIHAAEMQELLRALKSAQFSTDNLQDYLSIAYVFVIGVMSFFQIGLAMGTIRGRQRSRKLLLALLSVGFILTAVDTISGSALGGNLYAVFILMASHVFAMIEYTADGAVNYTHNSTEFRQRVRRAARA